jgi:GNAT superfamily N-acetyltransferase
MPAMLEFRIAQSADEALLKTCIESAYHEYPRLVARGNASLERSVELVLEAIAENGFAHIATLDGNDVGAAWWTPEGSENVLAVAYFVQPESRNQGIASKLLEAGIAEARRQGARSISIKTHPDNAASIALARKVGFEPVVALFRQDLTPSPSSNSDLVHG